MQIFVILFFTYYLEYLGQEDRNARNDTKKDDFPTGSEKNRRKSKYKRQEVDNAAYFARRKPQFHQSEMKMCGLLSFERIFPCEESARDDVDKIYDIYPKYCCCGRNFSSSDDGKCGNQKRKHDRPRVSHDTRAGNIASCQKKRCWYHDRKKCEKKSTIFLSGDTRVSDIELDCESCQYEKRYERKASCETRDSIRKVDRVEYEHIPKYRHKEWENIDNNIVSEDLKWEKEIIKFQYTSRDIGDVWYFDTRETDDGSDTYLHTKPKKGRDFSLTFAYSFHVIEKRYQRFEYPNHEDDEKSLFEQWWKIPKV